MNKYEIWGQEDEDNLAHSENYTVNEALGAEAETPTEALENMFRDVYTAAQAGVDLLPEPANGSHYHFKVIDVNTREEKEFSASYFVVPMLRIAELGKTPAEAGYDLPSGEKA